MIYETSTSTPTLERPHVWRPGDWAEVLAGKWRGIVGVVCYLTRDGGRLILGIRPQGGPTLEVYAADCKADPEHK